MLKWFILTVAVLLSVIGVLAWRLAASPQARTSSTVQSAARSADPQEVSAHLFTDAQVKDLFHKRGCVNCHDSKNTLVGPSFEAIAERYGGEAAARDTLHARLREGSQGAWGTAVMPGYNAQSVSDAEAEAMLEWVLEQISQ